MGEAIYIGYTRTVYQSAANNWTLALSRCSSVPSAGSALSMISATKDELHSINERVPVGRENWPVYSNALFIASSTGSALQGVEKSE